MGAPEDVVLAQLAAWSTLDVDEIVQHFSADAIYDEIPVGVHTGEAEIRQTIEGYVKRMDRADMEVTNVAVNGNLVMVERVDRFVWDGHEVAARCLGAFEVTDNKITAWRDYYHIPSGAV